MISRLMMLIDEFEVEGDGDTECLTKFMFVASVIIL